MPLRTFVSSSGGANGSGLFAAAKHVQGGWALLCIDLVAEIQRGIIPQPVILLPSDPQSG